MSRYDLFRRRIAPIAMLLAIGLLARDSCEKGKRAHTTVQLAFGAVTDNIRAVDVDVMVDGEAVASFHRAALPDKPIGPCEFKLSVADEDGELRIDIDRGAIHQRLTRKFHVVDGSTMLVSIPDDPGQP